MAIIKSEDNMIFNSDCFTKQIYNDNTGELDDEYFCFVEDDFSLFRDVARSKKFYLKKNYSGKFKAEEMKDVFLEMSKQKAGTSRKTEDQNDSEEEIIQVVWSDNESIQNQLVKLVEALEPSKSNSKFTLSMLEDDRNPVEIDNCEGEDIKGRFLEVKDSLEIIATSSKYMNNSETCITGCDITTEDEEKVNRIWKRTESPWSSSLHIEIGKLPSEADQDIVLRVLDGGAQGRINVREVTECLNNVLDSANYDNENESGKRVSFSMNVSTSLISKDSPSQISTHSQKSVFQKKVSFITDNDEKSQTPNDKPSKKVSFYDLLDDDCDEVSTPPKIAKIKKSVSFHDSVAFNTPDKIDHHVDNESSISEDAQVDLESVSTTGMYCSSDKNSGSSNLESMSNNSREKCSSSDATSGLSLAESNSTFSTRTSFEDNLEFPESQDLSDISVLSGQTEDKNEHLINYLNDQAHNEILLHDTDFDSGISLLDSSKHSSMDHDDRADLEMVFIEKTVSELNNENKCSKCVTDLGNEWETSVFIKDLIEESLSKKIMNCFRDGEIFHQTECNDLEKLKEICDSLQNINFWESYETKAVTDEINAKMAYPVEDLCFLSLNTDKITSDHKPYSFPDGGLSKPTSNLPNNFDDPEQLNAARDLSQHYYEGSADEYVSADSEGEVCIHNASISELSLAYVLSKYIHLNGPPPLDV